MVVQIQNVSRSFNAVEALRGINISVPKGSITVLLGPNGAGKTTAIRMITGALNPDRGTVRVFGLDPTTTDGELIRSKCGVVSAKPSLYDRLSGKDNLLYAAELYGIKSGETTTHRIKEAAAQFSIQDSLNLQVGGYSTGMKTRLALARAVLHKPELLLLDEPTSGLDPESAASVLEMVGEMTSQGQTVIMCTHLLLEAEGLADRIVVMEQGETIVDGVPDELSKVFWPNPTAEIVAQNGEDLDAITNFHGVISYNREGNIAQVELENEILLSDIILELSRHNIRLISVKPNKVSLEDLYFRIRKSSDLANSIACSYEEATELIGARQ